MKEVISFLEDDSAAITGEYAMLLSLITVTAVTAINSLQDTVVSAVSRSTLVIPN